MSLPDFKLEQAYTDKVNHKIPASDNETNGFLDLDTVQVTHEFSQQPVQAADDHLVEFAEAMITVEKALRRVAEGKAAAQAEAAEWKRKYELERERNLLLKCKAPKVNICHSDSNNVIVENQSNEYSINDAGTNQNDVCCGRHGICSHQILKDEVTDHVAHKLTKRKASFKLSWGCNGDKNGQQKHEIVSFEKGNITTAQRSSKQILLKWESQPQTVLILTKPNSNSVRQLCAEMVRWLKEHKNIDIVVEPRVKSELMAEASFFNFIHTWNDDEEIKLLHTKVDIVITLGGDGTVLWAASKFKGPVPPLVPFSLGSLGFMTPFQSEHYREYLDAIFQGPISITLRHRLQCNVVRNDAKDDLDAEDPILVLNEVTIDRGISSYLTHLECYCDNSFVTLVQGDGLILSTTSGSTAYSLAAGGSMVHPQVPGILFTPICPHSLSFRPLILPECSVIRVQVPLNSRGQVWASFDGKDRKHLAPGDALICSIAPWPVPTACRVDSTNDFLRSIHEGLHWNLRKSQSFDGPCE